MLFFLDLPPHFPLDRLTLGIVGIIGARRRADGGETETESLAARIDDDRARWRATLSRH
jgi:hypothetical protein